MMETLPGAGTGALAGTMVVEWSSGRMGAYTGKLLGGLGADVILLEHDRATREALIQPAPGPTHDGQLESRIRFLHGGKRSVQLDPAEAGGGALLSGLLEQADILILERPLREVDDLGLSPESLAERFPNLIVVALSLGGLDTEHRYDRHSDLVAHALGGIAYATPKVVPDVETHPPLKPGGYQADYSTGLSAASAALLGLQRRRRTSQGSLIDVSARAMVASFMRQDVTPKTFNGGTAMAIVGADRQSPNGRASTLWGLVPCKDGYFAFQASEQYQWEGLMRMMDDPDWAKAPEYQEPLDRVTYWDDIEPHFVGWTLEHDKNEIFHAAQREHVPVFPCYTIPELLADPQQIARSFFVRLPNDTTDDVIRVPGAIVNLRKTPWKPHFEAPAVGEFTAEAQASYGRAAEKETV